MKPSTMGLHTFRKSVIFKTLFVIGMLALLLTGCNSSSSNDDKKPDNTKQDKKNTDSNPDNTDSKPDNTKKDNKDTDSKPHAKSIQYTVSSLVNQSKDVEGLKKFQNSSIQSMQGLDKGSALEIMRKTGKESIDPDSEWNTLTGALNNLYTMDYNLIEKEFACGTATFSSSDEEPTTTTINLAYDGSCQGNSGSVALVIPIEDWLSMKWEDFNSGDCVINGEMLITRDLTYDETQSGTITFEFNQLSTCGEEAISANYKIFYDGAGNFIYKIGDAEYTYDVDGEAVMVSTDGITVDSNGVTNGKITVENEALTLKDVTIDKECSVPTAGKFNIDNPEGDPIVVDFENTTCDNPIVSYVVDDKEHTLKLDIDNNIPEPKNVNMDIDKDNITELYGKWHGTGKFEKGMEFDLTFENLRSETDGDATTIEFADIVFEFVPNEITNGIGAVGDSDVSGTIDGSTAKLVTLLGKDFNDPTKDLVEYVFTGTIKDGEYSGDIAIDGEKKTGTFKLNYLPSE